MFGLVEDIFDVTTSVVIGGGAGKAVESVTGSSTLGAVAGIATAGITFNLLDDD